MLCRFDLKQKNTFIVSLILVALTISVYWQVQKFEFINYDDQLYVTDNYRIQHGLNLKSITDTFTDVHTSHWHPLTMLSHMIDWQLFGNNAGSHHWMSVIIHLLNVILLFLLLKTMTGSVFRSALVAALFAVHPINLESVVWIAERKNVLSTFFWIMTMLLYVRYVRAPDWKRYLPVFVCLALGLMSKAMLVTLPFVLLLMDYWPLNRTMILDRQSSPVIYSSAKKTKISFLILEKIPLLLLSLFSTVITFYAMKSANAVASFEKLPLKKRVANALVSYTLYLKKLVWPIDLEVFYPHWEIPVWQVIASTIVLITVTTIVSRYFRKYPYGIVGWLWYVGTLFPVIGLTQVGHQAMADRYAYVPFIGLFLVIAWTVPQISLKLRYSKKYVFPACIAFIMVLAISSYTRIGVWRNTTTLFEDVLRVNPKNYLAYDILGQEKANKGQLEEAIYYYYMSLKLNPGYDSAYNNAGNAFLLLGKYPEAYNCYQKAILMNDKQAIANHNLGVLFALNKEYDQAVVYFNKALTIQPDYIDAHISLGATALKMGNIKDAIDHYEKVINLDPENISARKGLKDCMEIQKKLNASDYNK